MALMTKVGLEFIARNRANAQINSFNSSIKRMGRQMLQLAGVGGGLYAVKRGFDYIIKAAMKQEDALFQLEAALKVTEEYTAETMEGFEAFAASIQKATIYGDEEVLALMRMGSTLGISKDKLEEATKAALSLGAAFGGRMRPEMAMRYYAQALKGVTSSLETYVVDMRAVTTHQEKMIILQEALTRGWAIAEAQAETTSGTFKQMGNAVGDLAEVMIEPIMEPMTKNTAALTIIIQEATKALKKYQEAAVKAREAREKFGLRPMGFPRIPMPDIEGERKIKAHQKYIPEIVRFEEPEWLKNTLALNVMTEAQEKAAASMYAMSMKARGLSDELAREQKLTQFSALAKVRYGADVAGAQLAVERFTEALRESEELKARNKSLEIAKAAADRHKRISEDIAMSMASSWTNAIDQMMYEGKKFWDAMEDMARSLQREIFKIIMYKKMAEPLAYGIMGLPLPGTIAAVPTAAMTGQSIAPSGTPYWPAGSLQYGGTVLETGLAKVHRGEIFSGVQGGGMGTTEIRIHNEYTEEGERREVTRVEEEIVSGQRFLNIFMQKAKTDGELRRCIKQAAR